MSKSNKQAWFLSKNKMPVSKARAILRATGKVCLRCLSRKVYKGKRCKQCYDDRIESNKHRKR